VRQLLDRNIPVAGIDAVVHPGNLRELATRVSVFPVDIQDLGALLALAGKRSRGSSTLPPRSGTSSTRIRGDRIKSTWAVP
jgi:hypothetical protein